ncbi:MAG TPA: hypothetical protein VNA65_05450 [Candidatus Dormibacteraeota bacterium]|nr:hypothetical protein [Candidatus Dormibacteraeota bacterium]
MRILIAVVACAISACATAPGPNGVASASRTASPSPSAAAGLTTTVHCDNWPGPGHPMAVVSGHGDGESVPLGMVDVTDPTKPALACVLNPALGGRFLSPTVVAFWVGDMLGTVDLSTGKVVKTAQLPAPASTGAAFSADGSEFAYRSWDSAGGMTMHLFRRGSDKILYSQEPMGGHGGPGLDAGPFDRVRFSADGSELLDYLLFRPIPGPANVMVFRSDGSTLFQSSGLEGPAVWAGSTLYFGVYKSPSYEIDSLDSTGNTKTVISGLRLFGWPELAPGGSKIVYNTPGPGSDCGGPPHIWSLDLSTAQASQISRADTSIPVFVTTNVYWSIEEKLGQCGPGGATYPDGVVLAHDLTTGNDSPIDTSFYQPIGGVNTGGFSTTAVIDVRL